MKIQKKIYKIQRKIDNCFQRILRSKLSYNNKLGNIDFIEFLSFSLYTMLSVCYIVTTVVATTSTQANDSTNK